jgi:hypothetical protein
VSNVSKGRVKTAAIATNNLVTNTTYNPSDQPLVDAGRRRFGHLHLRPKHRQNGVL